MLNSESASQPLVNVVTVAEPVSVIAVVDAVHKVSYPPLRARFVVRVIKVLKHTIKLPAGNLPSPPTQLTNLGKV
jgi:hypothetical protein